MPAIPAVMTFRKLRGLEESELCKLMSGVRQLVAEKIVRDYIALSFPAVPKCRFNRQDSSLQESRSEMGGRGDQMRKLIPSYCLEFENGHLRP